MQNMRPGSPQTRSFLIPQPNAIPQEVPLLEQVFNMTELSVGSRPRPLASQPPRRNSQLPLQTNRWPYPKLSDTTSLCPKGSEYVRKEAQLAPATCEAPTELPSEPRRLYAAEFAVAEAHYYTLFTPSSPPRETSGHVLSAAIRRSRRSPGIVPDVANGRPPYPITPPTSPRDLTPTLLLQRIRNSRTRHEDKLPHPPKRAITVDDFVPTKRRRMSRLFVSQPVQLSQELHFKNTKPSNKATIPHKAVVGELEGSVFLKDEKALKRRSRSLPDLHFDFGFPVSETKTGFTPRDSRVSLKAGSWPIRKGFTLVANNEKVVETSNLVPWKIYAPDSTRETTYKAYMQEGLNPYLSEEVTTSVQASKPQKIKNRNYAAYIQIAEDHNFGDEVSTASKQALKAQKLKNRISSGFMPDQTPLTEVIKAATEGNFIYADLTDTIQDAESPISPIEPLPSASACETAISPAIPVSETFDKTKTAPTTFDKHMGTAANEVDELHCRTSGIEPGSDPMPPLAVTIVEPTPVFYRTLRRVRAAKVEMRSLARPLQPGKSANSGSLLDTPVPTTTTTMRSSRLLSSTMQKDDDSNPSWNWARFVDKDYEDPAIGHSRKFKEKKTWARNNTGPLVVFEPESWGGEFENQGTETHSSKRWSWREMTKGKSVNELLNLFEGR